MTFKDEHRQERADFPGQQGNEQLFSPESINEFNI